MRAGDDVAVECGDFVWIPDSMKDPSTRDKSEIAQKPEKISLPLLLSPAFLLKLVARQPLPHLLWEFLHRLIVTVSEGILLVKDSSLEANRDRKQRGFQEEVKSLLVRHEFLCFEISRLRSCFSVFRVWD